MTEETQVVSNNGKTKVLANGAVYDLDKKKIVSGAVLTSDKARELVQHRIERKRERVIAGAAKVLEKSGEWESPSDMDVVEAISEAVTFKALDPTNKQQIAAAKFIFEEAGLSAPADPRRGNAAENEFSIPLDAAFELARRLEAEVAARLERARAVDATASDATIPRQLHEADNSADEQSVE